MDIDNLKNLSKINLILGKNGCGKSVLLQNFDSSKRNLYKIKYIPPERGGAPSYNSGMEDYIRDEERTSRENRKNQVNNYRQQSFANFHLEEFELLRKDAGTTKTTSRDALVLLNSLLGQDLKIEEDKNIKYKISDKNHDKLSSGESEIISLCVDIVAFLLSYSDKKKILLLDEPDAHIHPDLQIRFIEFVRIFLEKYSPDAIIIIATHSTALINGEVNVCFMKKGDSELFFEPISDFHNKIVPITVAHPLSNIFNENIVLLVEGEDDLRIWQWTCRKLKGRLKLNPCDVGSESEMTRIETEANKLLPAIYDNPIIYSLRDKDNNEEMINNIGCIIRFRTSCTNAENLILSDESLGEMDLNWDQMKQRISDWISAQEVATQKHPSYESMKIFKEAGYNRKIHNIKDIRNTIVDIAGYKCDWEIAVGSAIAKNIEFAKNKINIEGSIFNYLGEKLIGSIFEKIN